jgi:hypothetical protein
MAGRKPNVPHFMVLDAVLLFKDRIVFTDDNGEKIEKMYPVHNKNINKMV